MKILGIDIGSYSVKIVEITTTNKSFQITHAEEKLIGINPAADKELEILEYLRELSDRYNQDNTKFITCLKQEKVSIRGKTLPFQDKIKISRSLPFELEEDLPYEQEKAIFDFKIISTHGASSDLLACATPKKNIELLLKLFKDAQIELEILSSESFAFSNLIEKWNEAPPLKISNDKIAANKFEIADIDPSKQIQIPKRSVQLNLHIGHTKTIVSVFEQFQDRKIFVSTRSIAWGSRHITDQIVKKYEIPFIEAQKELQSKAFILAQRGDASYDQVIFSETIAESLKDLARDIKMTILDLKAELNADIPSVELSGPCSQISNIHLKLTQLIEYPVNLWTPDYSELSGGFNWNTELEKSCSIALGLAIEGLKKPRNPAINFLKQEFAKQNDNLKKIWQKWGRIAQLSAVAIFAFYIYASLKSSFSSALLEQAQQNLKTQAKAVAKLPNKQQNKTGVEKYIKNQRKQFSQIEEIKNFSKMNSGLDIIKKISDTIPPKNQLALGVSRLQIQDKKVVMQGYVQQPQDVEKLKNLLATIAEKGKVESQPSQVQSGKSTYSFVFEIDRGVVK